MPCTCIKVVVDVAGKFGLQPQELNISLTAIGLLVSYVTYCLGFVRECSSMITTALSFQPRFSYVNVNTPLTRAASFCRVRISFTCCVGQFSRGEGSLYDLSLFVLKWTNLLLNFVVSVEYIRFSLATPRDDSYRARASRGFRQWQHEVRETRTSVRPTMDVLVFQTWRTMRRSSASGQKERRADAVLHH